MCLHLWASAPHLVSHFWLISRQCDSGTCSSYIVTTSFMSISVALCRWNCAAFRRKIWFWNDSAPVWTGDQTVVIPACCELWAHVLCAFPLRPVGMSWFKNHSEFVLLNQNKILVIHWSYAHSSRNSLIMLSLKDDLVSCFYIQYIFRSTHGVDWGILSCGPRSPNYFTLSLS